MLDLLKKLFGGREGAAETVPAAAAAPAQGPAGIEGFVSYVVREIVDSPGGVDIRSEENERGTVISIRCDKSDIGKVIGRNGKTIAAIRALANGAGGRVGKRISVEVMD